MKKILLLSFVLTLLICSFSNSKAANKKSKQPNIIYILADDLGYGDLGCYGQTEIKTPQIDKLAAKGLKFTNHYAGTAVCAPSRCSLMTGKHTGHTHIRNNRPLKFEGNEPIPDSEITIAELMKEAGYVTGAIGKWGIGYPGSEGDPINQGFDFFYGYNCQRQAHNYYPEHLWRNDKKEIQTGNLDGKEEMYSHDLFVEEALSFIKKNKDEKFFLYLPFTIPHTRFQVPDLGIYENKNWEKNHKIQAAMISRMDSGVGMIVDLIQKLGLDKNTLIIFTSDNGAHGQGGTLEKFNASGGLREKKGSMYEGGIRVPMIAYWPEKIEPGTESKHISGFWDVMPTLAEIAGVKPPKNIDGISMVPTILNQGK